MSLNSPLAPVVGSALVFVRGLAATALFPVGCLSTTFVLNSRQEAVPVNYHLVAEEFLGGIRS